MSPVVRDHARVIDAEKKRLEQAATFVNKKRTIDIYVFSIFEVLYSRWRSTV